jgi:hypothetical protein
MARGFTCEVQAEAPAEKDHDHEHGWRFVSGGLYEFLRSDGTEEIVGMKPLLRKEQPMGSLGIGIRKTGQTE